MASPDAIPYYPPEPPIAPHLRTSDELLAAAAEILARPDAEISEEVLDQACEKLWGAVTRRLRVFADARNWYFCERGVASDLVDRIDEALDTDPPELIPRFDSLELLRFGGFYDDILEPDDVRHPLPLIQSLCAVLDDAHRRLPLDLAPPDSRYYRRAAERCAERRAGASAG